jgi:hypothetical protein
MDEQTFNALLDGKQPTFEEFAGFVAVVERLPGELLWTLLTQAPSLNELLRKVVSKNLQDKVQRENVDNAVNAIAASMADRFQ